MLSCTGWGATYCLIFIDTLPIFPLLSLSILLISLPCSCLEEMKDHVESSEELDSILTDSTQSKGKDKDKGVEEALTLAHSHALISHTSLFISGFLLVATAAELKFTSSGESSALCSRVLPSFTLLVSVFSPVCLHLLSAGAGGRQAVCTCSSRATCICKSSLPISGP